MEEKKSPQEGQFVKSEKSVRGAEKEIVERKNTTKKNSAPFQQDMWLAS